MLNVAVVGAGPAGIYAAGALAEHGGFRVDVFDRLPAPFGLVRYGVAPDHPKIRSVSHTLAAMLEHPAVRFLGNVDIGTDLSVADLRRHYEAVILAQGAAVDRHLGIPGEHLPGSASATELVAWYCGHPDVAADRFTLDATAVAVIGVGNVAADLVRILGRPAAELAGTEVPGHVLAALQDSRISDIHLIGRRGPLQTKITIRELREIGDLADADILLDPADLVVDEMTGRRLTEDPALRRVWKVMQEWAAREPAGRRRRVHVHFLQRPLEIVGAARVEGLVLGRNSLRDGGDVDATDETTTIAVQQVYRSIGYRGVALPGVAFDERRGIVPNDGARVLADGQPVEGLYATGWIKRGPTGVIGTNKHDAHETVAALIADAPLLSPVAEDDPGAILKLLADRGVDVVTWAGWAAIEAAELTLGRAQGRVRATIQDRQELLRAAAGR